MESDQKMKPGRGRPCLGDEKRARRVSVRIMPSEYQRLEVLQNGRSINQLMIDLINEAFEKHSALVP